MVSTDKVFAPALHAQGCSVTSVEIEHRYGNFVALDKVSLDVRPASSSPCSARAARGSRLSCGSSPG